MSCTNCSTDTNGVPKGCKSNGDCGSGSCGSGSKLAVFDWLANMEVPNNQEKHNIVEVRFKNGRKHFYKNEKKLPITLGDVIVVEGNPGHDVGIVSLTGELIKIQMKKKKIAMDSDEVKKVYRKASQKEVDTWQEAQSKELETQRKGREIINRLGLKMKLSDVEYQGDGKKATFYYTADERVDFRMLIREFASTFGIRIEMKQVGLRQEAARLGGIGSCGRELCCSTWLTDFRKVSTAAARYQQLSLNPIKLAGQCGKLKCCLNFELDSYLDALKAFPKKEIALKTEKGLAYFVKMDIFKGVSWYTYKGEDFSKWFELNVSQLQEILALNKKGEKAPNLETYKTNLPEEPQVVFEDAVGQDSLTRFDKPKRRRSNRNNKRRRNNNQNRNKQKTTAKNGQQNKQKSNNANKKKNYRNSNRNRNPKKDV